MFQTPEAVRKSEDERYVLWFLPKETRVVENLQRIIREIGEKYSTTVFQPHITLISSIREPALFGPESEVVAKTASLAGRLRPFAVKLGEVETGDQHFQAIIVRISGTPEIFEAYNTALEVFGKQKNPDFMPHLSLMYSDTPKAEREKIVKEYDLEREMRALKQFTVQELSLRMRVKGAEKWLKVRDFKLGKG